MRGDQLLTEDEKLQLCLERDRLLCDPEFMRSPTMSKLLRFLVNYRLSDNVQPLKSYTIAVDALGRTDGFDTQVDSYPRVQMGRLRRMLDHFYLRNGGANRLIIPYNHYEILLAPNGNHKTEEEHDKDPISTGEAQKEPANRRQAIAVRLRNKTWSCSPGQLLAGLAVLVVLMVAGIYLLRPERMQQVRYPAIIVSHPEGRATGAGEENARAIQTYLVSALTRFDQVRVYDAEPAEEGGPEYLLETSVLDQMGNRIQLRLVDSATGEVIWSDRVEIADPSMLEINLSKNVIAIASPYGVIARSELARNGDSYEPGYPCLLQFHQYLRYREKSDLKPVLECIDRSARRFSGDAYMLSMLAVAKEISTRVDSPYRIEGSSREMAQRAAQLDNRSSSAAFAVAQSAFIEGNCERGVAWGRRAVDLNPLNSRVVGYLGLYMLGCRLPEGEEYTARALEMDPNTDLVVAATLAFQKLQRGDAKGARELSLKYMATAEKVEPGLEVTYILSTAALGDHREARRAWQRLTKSYDLPETATPRQVMRGWIANPAVLRQVELAFEKVGLY